MVWSESDAGFLSSFPVTIAHLVHTRRPFCLDFTTINAVQVAQKTTEQQLRGCEAAAWLSDPAPPTPRLLQHMHRSTPAGLFNVNSNTLTNHLRRGSAANQSEPAEPAVCRQSVFSRLHSAKRNRNIKTSPLIRLTEDSLFVEGVVGRYACKR